MEGETDGCSGELAKSFLVPSISCPLRLTIVTKAVRTAAKATNHTLALLKNGGESGGIELSVLDISVSIFYPWWCFAVLYH